jgi:hypothetical protein
MSGALDLKPAFQAEKLEGEFTRTVMCIEEDIRKVGPNQDKSLIIRKLVPRQEKYEGAYMIYFPQGHSIHVAADDVEQLQRIGVFDRPDYVDMNTGEVVPANVALSPKEIVERRTRTRIGPNRTGGLSNLTEELGE